MLSIWTIKRSSDAVSYFEKDNYYTKDGGYEHSSWIGKGAKALGLNGEIKPGEFAQVLEGNLPGGKHLSRATIRKGKDGKPQERLPGTDMTFSAPKSVSIAALICGDSAIIEAHKNAVSRAMDFAEAHGAVCLKKGKKRKNIVEKTGNLLIARFDHDTARETKDAPPDPQLHSHCVVMNATKRADGKWVSCPNRFFLENKMLLGAIYRGELAHELQNLGYSIERTHDDGRFEIAPFTREQIEAFSHRREDVEKYMKKHGLESSKGASLAAKETRKRKKNTDRTSLKSKWIEAAASIGIAIDPNTIKNSPIDPQKTVLCVSESDSANVEARRAVQHLSERESILNKYDLLKVAMQRGVGSTRIDHIQKAFTQLAKDHNLLKVDTDRFTTPKLLTLENLNIEMLTGGLNAYKSFITKAEAQNYAVAQGLNYAQSEAVALLSSTSRFVGVQGNAGTGKSTMLGVMSKLAKEHDFVVHGLAPTAAAAKSLENESGIKSQTIDRFLLRKRKERHGTGANEIWMVDEASMMSTTKANRLFKLAKKENARVWLIGDQRQLGSIEAGNPFALAIRKGMPYVEMKEILRQKNKILKSAVELSAEEKPEEALHKLVKDVVAIKGREDCLERVVHSYFDGKKQIPKDSIVITSLNEDRRDINSLIRKRLIKYGNLGENTVQVPRLSRKHHTKEELRRTLSYAPNDVVTFDRSYKSLKVKKDEVFKVVSVDANTGKVSLKRNDSPEVFEWLPRRAGRVQSYHPVETSELRENDLIRWTKNERSLDIRNGETATVKGFSDGMVKLEKNDSSLIHIDLKKFPHWDHAYCSTIYSSQGKTYDRAVIHLDTSRSKDLIGREQFYVAISRARHEAKIFTNDLEALPKAIQPSRAQENAVESVGGKKAFEKIKGFDRGR